MMLWLGLAALARPPVVVAPVDVGLTEAWRSLRQNELAAERGEELSQGLVLRGDPHSRVAFEQVLVASLNQLPELRETFLALTSSPKRVTLQVGRNLASGGWPLRVGVTFDRFERRLRGRKTSSAPNWQLLDIADLLRIPTTAPQPWGSDRAQNLLHMLVEMREGSAIRGGRTKRYRRGHAAAIEVENALRERRGQAPITSIDTDTPSDTGVWTFHYADGAEEIWHWHRGSLRSIRYHQASR